MQHSLEQTILLLFLPQKSHSSWYKQYMRLPWAVAIVPHVWLSRKVLYDDCWLPLGAHNGGWNGIRQESRTSNLTKLFILYFYIIYVYILYTNSRSCGYIPEVGIKHFKSDVVQYTHIIINNNDILYTICSSRLHIEIAPFITITMLRNWTN